MVQKALSHGEPRVAPRGGGDADPFPPAAAAADVVSARVPAADGAAEELQAGMVAEEVGPHPRNPEPTESPHPVPCAEGLRRNPASVPRRILSSAHSASRTARKDAPAFHERLLPASSGGWAEETREQYGTDSKSLSSAG